MQITLDEGYNAMCDFVYLGYVGEVNAREISVFNYAIPEATAYKLKIEYPDKTVYELPIKNGICSLGASIFKTACEVKCQIVAYAVEGEVYKLVRKSDIFKQEIRSSIDESGIPSYEESLDALDKILQYESNSKEYAERAEAAAIKSEESEGKSTLSALNASNSEQAAKTSEENAKLSESNSKASESNAKQSELNAKSSEEVAKQHSADAKTYSLNAKSSEGNAKVSEKNAQTYSESAERFSEIASTASQNAENSKDSANTYANNAKASASAAKLSETNASKSETATAGYAQTAKTNADSTAADRQAVQEMATQVTADKTTVADNATKVAEDRTAAETAAQTAQAVADSLPEDYTTAVAKIAENTAEIGRVKLTDKELQRRVDALFDMGQGVTHRFETDSDAAYQKTVPTGAKLMSVKSVGGRSIVFNQSFQQENANNHGIIITADSDGTLALNGTTTDIYVNLSDITPEQNKIGKYMFKLLILNNPDNIEMSFGFLNRNNSTPFITSGSSAVIYNQTQSEISRGNSTGIKGFEVGTAFNDVKIKIQIFDLTAMFGIGNEPASVEEFEKIFPADYYPYNAGEIVSAGVTEVSVGDTAHPIPEAIRNLPGYGWSAGTARNYVDYENKKYYQCVGSVDLGTLDWTYSNTPFGWGDNQWFTATVQSIKVIPVNTQVANILCKKYTTRCAYGADRNDFFRVDKSIGQHQSVVGVTVLDTAYTDAAAFKQAMQDVMLYYELETPIVTDISTMIPDDFLRNIAVEAGGSITFKNSNGDSYRIPVPSEEEYIVKLSEVGGTT